MTGLLDILPGWMFGLGVAAGLAALLARARRWFAGRPAAVDVKGGLRALPRRYLVDVHAVIARSPSAARMHVAVAGGFTASLPLILLVHVLGVKAPWAAYALLGALAVMFAGAVLAADRPEPGSSHHSAGRWERLPLGLIAYAAAFTIATIDDVNETYSLLNGLLVLGFGTWGCLSTLALAASWPLRHAPAGALYLMFHPRPGRFGTSRPDVALAPLDLGAQRLGAETARDFAWNALLGFDACVQCGRCEVVCPAFAAGQPLNPKKLIQDLVIAMAPGVASDAGYTGNPHPGRSVGLARGGRDRPIVGDLVHPDTLWACTTCGHCVYECPMMIEHVDAVIELRRFQALEAGRVPGKAAVALENTRLADEPGGHDPARRLDWAADLNLRTLAPGASCETLLWQGEAAFDLRGQRTLRALVALLRKGGVDFAVLGAELDTGDLARRLGDEATFQALARRNVAMLESVRFQRIVTADPHVLNSLRNDYPALGGRYTVVHHTAVLADLIAAGRIVPAKSNGGRVTYHDPCYLGRYNGEIAAPRAVLGALGVDLVEMERHGLRSTCCGGGGGAPLTDVPGTRRVPDVRMDMARETGAAVVAVACPNCAVMLEGVTGTRPRVADVAELVLEAVA